MTTCGTVKFFKTDKLVYKCYGQKKGSKEAQSTPIPLPPVCASMAWYGGTLTFNYTRGISATKITTNLESGCPLEVNTAFPGATNETQDQLYLGSDSDVNSNLNSPERDSHCTATLGVINCTDHISCYKTRAVFRDWT
jgi:hypothetical protein